MREKFLAEVMVTSVGELTAIWRAAFDQMVQAFPLKH